MTSIDEFSDNPSITSLQDALLQAGMNAGYGKVRAVLGVTLEPPLGVDKLTYTYFHMIHSLVATLPVGSYITFVSERGVSIRITFERLPKAQTKEPLLPPSGVGSIDKTTHPWWQTMEIPSGLKPNINIFKDTK